MQRRNIGHSRVKNLSKMSNFKNPSGEKRITESTNEYTAACFLNYFPIVKSFQFQPLAFNYEWRGNIHSYTADFLAELENGEFTYVEIKEEKALFEEDFESKFKAKKAAAELLGKELILVTEKQYVIPNKTDNIKSLLNYVGFQPEESVSKLVLLNVQNHKAVDVESIAYQLSQFTRDEIWRAINSLILKRTIYFDLFGSTLTFESEVSNDVSNYDNTEFFFDEFDSFDFTNKLPKVEVQTFPKDMDVFPDKYKTEALARKKCIKWFESKGVKKWTEKHLKPLLDELPDFGFGTIPPSARSIHRWRRAYVLSGRKLISLVPSHAQKGRTIAVSEHDKYIDYGINKYLSKLRLSVSECYREYETQLKKKTDLDPVSYNTFKHRIDLLPKYDVMCAREGKVAADIEFNYYSEQRPPKRLYEEVEIDHTVLNIMLLDSKHFFPIGRPYLTIVIDKLSHCICGFYLSFEPPSYNSARRAILHSIKSKSYVEKVYPSIKNEWSCHGKIENLITDNGAEFWGENLEIACEDWLNIRFNPVGKPWKKPYVERFINTTCREFAAKFKGKTFSNILEKMKYDPETEAMLTFDVFVELFHRWIIDDYHQRSDSRFKYIPAQLWQDNYQKAPVLNLNQNELEKLEVDFLCTKKRTWRKGGFHIFCLRYDSPYLSSLRTKHVLKGEEKGKYLIKYDPENINSIKVYIDKIEKYVEVPCVDSVGYTKNLSLFNHQINLRLHRKYIKSKIDVDSLQKYREYILERVIKEEEKLKEIKAKRKASCKARSRYKSVNSHNVSADNTMNTDLPEVQQDKHSSKDWNDFANGLEGF